MITMTAVQFAENPSHAQKLAENEPVLVANGDKKQVLLGFEEYQALTSSNAPALNSYEFLSRMVSGFSDEELEILANDDTCYDMSEQN